jgi:DNA invertase Pin-like site-specific DNA recombinase
MSERAVLYLRQSVAREDSISLELQEHEGRAYAKRQGYEIVAVEADPGISGRTWNRPAVKRVMELIDSKQAEVIVLWKWSRLSRSRLDWAVAADRVQVAGGRIESATEPLDTTTSTGRLARGMLTEFAAFESERIGDGWKESHARRIRQGLPINGKPRFGYQYARGDWFTIAPLEGAVLAEAFRRYIAGESVYSLVQWMNHGPTRPVGGYGVKGDGLWSDRTLRRVMDSGFAAGFIRNGDELMPGAHEALIDPSEWDAYQEARQRRRVYRRVERSQYLFSGLVRCSCGSAMTAGQFGAQHTAKYRCVAAKEKRTHTGGYVMESTVEANVLAWLTDRELRLSAEIATASKTPRTVKKIESVDIDAKLAVVASRLDSLSERLIDSDIPHDSYVRLRDKYLAEQQALRQARLTVTVQAKVEPIRVIPVLLENWHLGKVEEKREILRALIDHVEVFPGHPRARIVVHPRE